MAPRLNPYLNFTGNARQAIEFYQSVLGGTLTVTTFGTPQDVTLQEIRLECFFPA